MFVTLFQREKLLKSVKSQWRCEITKMRIWKHVERVRKWNWDEHHSFLRLQWNAMGRFFEFIRSILSFSFHLTRFIPPDQSIHTRTCKMLNAQQNAVSNQCYTRHCLAIAIWGRTLLHKFRFISFIDARHLKCCCLRFNLISNCIQLYAFQMCA